MVSSNLPKNEAMACSTFLFKTYLILPRISKTRKKGSKTLCCVITISKRKTLEPLNVKVSKRKIEKELTFEGHTN